MFAEEIQHIDRQTQLKAELVRLLEIRRYKSDFYLFLTECLGLDFPEIRDPQVKIDLKEFGDLILMWFQRYQCMNRKCIRYETAADIPIQNKEVRAKFLKDWRKRKDAHRCVGQKERLLVFWEQPRGTCKTAGPTTGGPAFVHTLDTEIPMGIMSAEKERMAEKFSATCKQHWQGQEGAKLVDLFGPYVPDATRKWTDSKMTTAQRRKPGGEATLSVFSVETGATSGHYKFFVMDDPTTQALVNKHGDGWHDKVESQFQEFNTIVDRDGMLIVVYTRYGEGDLPGRWKEAVLRPMVEKKYGAIPDDFDMRWGKYANEMDNLNVYVHQSKAVEHDENGVPHAVYKDIWPLERIEAIREQGPKGETFYATQLQNNPADRADNEITDAILNRMVIQWTADMVEPEFYWDLTIQMDTAFKDIEAFLKQRGDWNVITVHGNKNGRVRKLWSWHGRVTQAQFGKQWVRSLQWCLEDKVVCGYKIPGTMPRIATCDKTSSGGVSLKQFLQDQCSQSNMAYPNIKEINRNAGGMQGSKQKMRAVRETFGYLQDGRYEVMEGLQGNTEFFHQLRLAGAGIRLEHDDHVDAFKDVFHPDVYRVARVEGSYDKLSKRRGPRPMVHGDFDDDGTFVPRRRARFMRDREMSPFQKIMRG